MIKYYCKAGQRGIGMYNSEEDAFDVLEYASTNIDWAYVIPEDGEFTYRSRDEKTETKSVKKYDIVLQLYTREYNKHDFLIIRSKEWKENLKSQEAYYTKKNEQTNTCDGCDNCEMCCEKCAA